MKTYKTWEVIKMLTENPELKFKTIDCLNKELVISVNELPNNTGHAKKEIIFSRNYYMSLTDTVLNYEWTLVKEPVDFMTAYNSWKNEGKRIKSEVTKEHVSGPFRNNIRFYSEEIKGKWYIEEDEE